MLVNQQWSVKEHSNWMGVMSFTTLWFIYSVGCVSQNSIVVWISMKCCDTTSCIVLLAPGIYRHYMTPVLESELEGWCNHFYRSLLRKLIIVLVYWVSVWWVVTYSHKCCRCEKITTAGVTERVVHDRVEIYNSS
jgi:hypothetical protein